MMKKILEKILARNQRSTKLRKRDAFRINRFTPSEPSLLGALKSAKNGYDLWAAYLEKKQKPKSPTRRRSGFLRRLYRTRRDR